jgi:hypothetical protein
MIWIYIGLIALAALPLWVTILRMRRSGHVKKHGVHVSGRIAGIKTIRATKGRSLDILSIEYKERANGRIHYAKATVPMGKYRLGDPFPVAYLPNKPEVKVIGLKTGYLGILIFCIIVFLLVILAVYKINELMKAEGIL